MPNSLEEKIKSHLWGNTYVYTEKDQLVEGVRGYMWSLQSVAVRAWKQNRNRTHVVCVDALIS